MSDKPDNSILILGRPASSKTVFLAQLILISRKKDSKISFWKNPDINDHLKSAIERLRKGLEPESTHADSSFKITLPIRFNNQNLELVCPDYGGEQINSIVKFKEINKEWLDFIKKSKHWILFIRPSSIEKHFDLTTKSPGDGTPQKKSRIDLDEYKPSDEVIFTELIQILIHTKGLNSDEAKEIPKITIALTCWDELHSNDKPPAMLFNHTLPLLSQFLNSKWRPENIRIIGVSALGLSLSNKTNSKKYVNHGPDKFPFVVLHDSNKRITDLSYVIQETLR